MEISEAEFARANRRLAKRRKTEPYAVAAEYEAARNMIAVSLSNGAEVRFPVSKLEGLAKAKADELAQIEIDPAGYGLSFPKLDVDFSLPALMGGYFRLSDLDGGDAWRTRGENRQAEGKRWLPGIMAGLEAGRKNLNNTGVASSPSTGKLGRVFILFPLPFFELSV